MATPVAPQSINQRYGRSDLAAAILAAVRAAGKDPDALTVDDLAPVDQFHTRGKAATLELAHCAGLGAGMKVLDVGSGIGGPARTLAPEFGCVVTVLDLTEEYCRTRDILTARASLSDRVPFRHGSALDMPFADAHFDAVWTQHSSMNIADKERLYTETVRVLRPGGRLALHKIMAGPVSPIHFPVPWARDPAISFLRPPEAIHALLLGIGFREIVWMNKATAALEWFQQRLAATASAPGGPPPLGLHLLLGADFGTMFHNQVRNLQEQRVTAMQGVFARPQ